MKKIKKRKKKNKKWRKKKTGEKKMQQKACRNCRKLMEQGEKCPNCQGTSFTTFWRGMVVITNPENSEIAKKMGISSPGKYALRLSR